MLAVKTAQAQHQMDQNIADALSKLPSFSPSNPGGNPGDCPQPMPSCSQPVCSPFKHITQVDNECIWSNRDDVLPGACSVDLQAWRAVRQQQGDAPIICMCPCSKDALHTQQTTTFAEVWLPAGVCSLNVQALCAPASKRPCKWQRCT